MKGRPATTAPQLEQNRAVGGSPIPQCEQKLPIVEPSFSTLPMRRYEGEWTLVPWQAWRCKAFQLFGSLLRNGSVRGYPLLQKSQWHGHAGAPRLSWGVDTLRGASVSAFCREQAEGGQAEEERE
jgi:hypothetical protein